MKPNNIVRIVNGKQKTPELEIYNSGRYFTMTGNVFGNTKPIAERNVELQSIIDLYNEKKSADHPVQLSERSRAGIQRNRLQTKKYLHNKSASFLV